MNKHTHEMLARLEQVLRAALSPDDLPHYGDSIARQDAADLRRISMTLHRWHELECGDSNDYASWTVVRGKRTSTRIKTEQGLNVRRDTFEYDDAGKPYMETHHHTAFPNLSKPTVYTTLPDREAGALKRLAKIMARYPALSYYVQTDQRGCALYILRPGDVPAGASLDSCYSNGLAVFK